MAELIMSDNEAVVSLMGPLSSKSDLYFFVTRSSGAAELSREPKSVASRRRLGRGSVLGLLEAYHASVSL